MIDLKAAFAAHHDEFLKFERIEKPRTKRRDLHAFLMLDELVPGTKDIIGASEHDEFFLSIELDALAKVITDEQVRDLVRCGVRHSSSYDCLCMFA